MTIEKQISGLRRLIKQISNVKITTVKLPNGDIRLKWGKKLNMIDCPSQEWADLIKDNTERLLLAQQEKAAEVISLLEQRMEQLTLSLFEKGEPINERTERV